MGVAWAGAAGSAGSAGTTRRGPPLPLPAALCAPVAAASILQRRWLLALGCWAAAALVRERERERQRERGRGRGIRGHPPSDDGLDNLPDHTHSLPP